MADLPSRHHFYKMRAFCASYAFTRQAVPSQEREDELVRPYGEDLARLLNGSELVSLAPNSTGLQFVLKASVPVAGGTQDKRMSFPVCPFERERLDRTCRGRTMAGVFEELGTAMAKHAMTVPEKVVSRSQFHGVTDAMLRIAYEESRKSPFLRSVLDAVNRATEDGTLEEAYRAHQSKRSLTVFRETAMHALGFGVPLSDLASALDECVVRSAMEK